MEQKTIKKISVKIKDTLPQLLTKQLTVILMPVYNKYIENSKPRFELLDKIQVRWNYNNPFETFCRRCGEPIVMCNHNAGDFKKVIGNAEITKVYSLIANIHNKDLLFNNFTMAQLTELAQKAGFETTYAFQKYILSHFYLGKDRLFFVYEFRWLADENN